MVQACFGGGCFQGLDLQVVPYAYHVVSPPSIFLGVAFATIPCKTYPPKSPHSLLTDFPLIPLDNVLGPKPFEILHPRKPKALNPRP